MPHHRHGISCPDLADKKQNILDFGWSPSWHFNQTKFLACIETLFRHVFWHISWHSFWHIFWHAFWHIFWHFSCISPDILSDILSGRFWHSFCICSDILSGVLSGISSDSRLRSGGEHCHPALAVEVRRRRTRRTRRRTRRTTAAYIKSNKPHLTGGEKPGPDESFVLLNMEHGDMMTWTKDWYLWTYPFPEDQTDVWFEDVIDYCLWIHWWKLLRG